MEPSENTCYYTEMTRREWLLKGLIDDLDEVIFDLGKLGKSFEMVEYQRSKQIKTRVEDLKDLKDYQKIL